MSASRRSTIPLTRILAWGLGLVFAPAPVAFAADPSWHVLEGRDPISGEQRCLLKSDEKSVDDGQTTTTVRIVYNGEVFVVRTDSHIDLSYPNVGMQVDRHEPIPVDRLLGENSVVFETEAEQIRGRFERGTEVRVALGFWPTWPQTETIVTPFSLIGFTRAHAELVDCGASR